MRDGNGRFRAQFVVAGLLIAAAAGACGPLHVDYARRGARAFAQGDLEASARAYGRAIEENAGVGEYYAGLGRTLNEMGRYAEAEPSLRRAIGFRPYDADWHWWLGLSLAGQEKWQAGITEIGIARRYAPGNRALMIDLGMMNLYRGELDAATRILASALEASPRRADAAFAMGLVAHRAGRFAEAIASFRDAETLESGDWSVYAAILRTWVEMDHPAPPRPAPPPPEVSLPQVEAPAQAPPKVTASNGAAPKDATPGPASPMPAPRDLPTTRPPTDPEARLDASPWVKPAQSASRSYANPWEPQRGLVPIARPEPAPPAAPEPRNTPEPPATTEPSEAPMPESMPESTLSPSEPAPAQPMFGSQEPSLRYYCEAAPAGTAREIACFVSGQDAAPSLASGAPPRDRTRLYYFVGMQARRRGDDFTARRYLQLALETGIRNDWAWREAAWALGRR